jgi:MFS family permease
VLLGLREVARRPDLRLVAGVMTGSVLAEGAIDVLVVVAALSLLGIGDGGAGVLNSAWGVGGLAGGAAALRVLVGGRLASGVALGLALIAAPLVLLAALPGPALAVAALAVLGVGYAFVEVGSLTLMQRLVADRVLGRAFAAIESGYWLATGAGALLAPVLVSLLGARGAIAAVGIGLGLLLLASRTALARLDPGRAGDEREFALLRGLPVFAPLPLAEVETLTLRLGNVPVASGEVVFSQGEAGDRFYVVGDGRVEVLRDGDRVAVIGAGGSFGELALLNDCPRNATVRAIEDGRLYALARGPFIETVTAHMEAA